MESAAAIAAKETTNENNKDFSFTGLPYRGLGLLGAVFAHAWNALGNLRTGKHPEVRSRK